MTTQPGRVRCSAAATSAGEWGAAGWGVVRGHKVIAQPVLHDCPVRLVGVLVASVLDGRLEGTAGAGEPAGETLAAAVPAHCLPVIARTRAIRSVTSAIAEAGAISSYWTGASRLVHAQNQHRSPASSGARATR
jgi:hypothetical protein